MSTLFAVKKDYAVIDVARRSGGVMYWINDLADMLPDKIKVYPIDNSAQGIYTIGDIKKAIRTGNICPKE